MEQLRVLSSPGEIIAAFRGAGHSVQDVYKAFYSSRLNAIITDPALMQVPIDDHMVHRGHSVFDTLLVVDGKTFLLRQHLNRLVNSARTARITLPMPPEEIATVLKEVAASTQLRTSRLRFWISAGPGNMAIWPEAGMSVLYVLVLRIDDPRVGMQSKPGHPEFTVSIPMKPQLLATMKSTNYLLNALCAMEAKGKGGSQGFQTDADGFISECAVGNAAFLLPGNRLVTPGFDSILQGTVITRVLEYGKRMVTEGELTAVEQRNLHISEAKTALEVIECGGDSLTPIIAWDGVPVGTGQPGPVWRRLVGYLIDEMSGTDPTLLESIPYDHYNLI